MTRKKIVCLTQDGCRFPMMIVEGLQSYLGAKDILICDKDWYVLAKPILKANFKFSDLKDCDFIFLPAREHYYKQDVIQYIDSKRLWNKVVVIDFKDSGKIEKDYLSKCYRYFKRSWPRNRVKEFFYKYKNIYPLNFSCLSAYKEISDKYLGRSKKIDIGCYFNITSKGRRGNLVRCARDEDWGPVKTVLNRATNAAWGEITDSPENNSWVTYYRDYICNSKVILTASHEDWQGDSRTWEAVISGALVFLDKTSIPTENYFNNKHVIEFDSTKRESIKNMFGKVKHYLHNKQTMQKISKNCREHAIRYHMPKNRIEYIFSKL